MKTALRTLSTFFRPRPLEACSRSIAWVGNAKLQKQAQEKLRQFCVKWLLKIASQHKAQGVLLFLKIASSTLCLSTIRNAVQNPDDDFGSFWLEIPVDYKKHFTNFKGYTSFVNVIICTHICPQQYFKWVLSKMIALFLVQNFHGFKKLFYIFQRPNKFRKWKRCSAFGSKYL